MKLFSLLHLLLTLIAYIKSQTNFDYANTMLKDILDNYDSVLSGTNVMNYNNYNLTLFNVRTFPPITNQIQTIQSNNTYITVKNIVLTFLLDIKFDQKNFHKSINFTDILLEVSNAIFTIKPSNFYQHFMEAADSDFTSYILSESLDIKSSAYFKEFQEDKNHVFLDALKQYIIEFGNRMLKKRNMFFYDFKNVLELTLINLNNYKDVSSKNGIAFTKCSASD